MAGRSRNVRNIQSYINRSDSHSGLGPLKAGTGPAIGVTHYLWHNISTECSKGPLDKINSQAYYSSLIWQRYGNLRPSFRPSPRERTHNFSN